MCRYIYKQTTKKRKKKRNKINEKSFLLLLIQGFSTSRSTRETDKAARPGNTIITVTTTSDTSTTSQPLGDSTVLSSIENTGRTSEDDMHEQRANYLRQACEKSRITEPLVSSQGMNSGKLDKNFFVDEGRHLVYCAVPKVGSSVWKRVFRILNNLEPRGSLFRQSGLLAHVHTEDLTFYNKGSQWKRKMLRSSLKFLFVRDPFARLFSAYIDKIFLPFGFGQAAQIVNERGQNSFDLFSPFSQNSESDEKCRMAIPTFATIVHEAVSDPRSVLQYNPHFVPIYRQCKPCTTHFNIVGKMESFLQDTEYILRKVGLTLDEIAEDRSTFDTRNDLNIMSEIAQRTLSSPVWKQLHDPICRPARHQILRRMWTVFKVRGLVSAELPFPPNIPLSGEVTLRALLRAIQTSYQASGDKEKRRQQRDAAMMEAFRSVPIADLAKLGAIFKTDCELFGYDCSLTRFDHTQNGANVSSDYSYFRDWQ